MVENNNSILSIVLNNPKYKNALSEDLLHIWEKFSKI